jgi:hypothetical protein
MNVRLHLGLGLSALLMTMTAACGGKSQPDDAEGMAAGLGARQPALAIWKKLGAYDDEYLKSWKGALADPDPAPRDVLDAFNELGFAVTGPAGFWRKTVPDQWFGCQAEPGTPPCKALSEAAANELKAWDTFQAEIAALPDGQEAAFIGKHQKRMLDYFDTWVPDAPSMSAMKSTGFYKAKLDKALGVNANNGGDDL